MRVEMQAGVHVKSPLFCPILKRVSNLGKFSVSPKLHFFLKFRQRDLSLCMQTFGHADRKKSKVFAALY